MRSAVFGAGRTATAWRRGAERNEEYSRQRNARKPDGELIAACLAGSEPAWDSLIGRYRGLIFSVALKSGLSQADAADVLQEVSLALVRHLENLRDRARLSQWLVITTKREAWHLARRRKARASDSPLDGTTQEISDDSAPLDALLFLLEDQVLVRRALDALSPQCREALTCLYCCDPPLSYIETAAHLNIPSGSVGAARLRCLKQMKKLLDEMGF